MSTQALLMDDMNLRWHKQLTDMLFISRLSTKPEIERAYHQEKAMLDVAQAQDEFEKQLLSQKRECLEQAYHSYLEYSSDEDDAELLAMAYDDAAGRAMQLAAVPFILWLISRIINIPLNWLADCTRCSCCNDESCLCCLPQNCCNDAYDKSNLCRIIDTGLFAITMVAIAISIIAAIATGIKNAIEQKRFRHQAKLREMRHREEMKIYKEYYDRMSALETRYNELRNEFSDLSEMSRFLTSVGNFLDAVDQIQTNDALDRDYRAQTEQMKRNYIEYWHNKLRMLQEDVRTADSEAPRFVEMTAEETSGLSEFQSMVIDLARVNS